MQLQNTKTYATKLNNNNNNNYNLIILFSLFIYVLTQQPNVQEMSHRCHVTDANATGSVCNQFLLGGVRVNWSVGNGRVSTVLFLVKQLNFHDYRKY